MKILHIHASMQQGGIEAMITALANEMQSQGENVSVCSIFKPTSQAIFWNKLAPNIHKFDLGKSKPGFSLKEIFKIYNFIRKNNFDVVNIHGFFYYYALTILLRHSKTKFFYTVHSDARMENTGWDKKFFKFKQFCFKKKWVKPITISAVSQKSFNDFYNCDSSLIYNGVVKSKISSDCKIIDEARITPDTKVFLHPGRITLAKNQIVLVKAFDYLIKKGKDIALIIVGRDEDKDILNEIKQFFSDRIQFIGVRSDVPDMLSKCDGLCLSSIWEGLPVTLLEALSVGCIPICTPVGGIVDIIKSGENGILSNSSSLNDYISALSEFLELSEAEVHKMKCKCLESFQPYDIQNVASNYLELYTSNINQ